MSQQALSSYQSAAGVVVITLDNPPVNALGLALRLRLEEALRAAMANRAVRAIVLSGAGRGFCAGGDITEFDLPAITQSPSLMALFGLIEDSPKPVVAAIHGMALGGGLELAMACHARVAHEQALVGLPEVHLGLIPGAGGTQRLPRLVGVETALNLIVQGRTCQAYTMRDSGLFDQLTSDEPLDAAQELALKLADQVESGSALRRTGQLNVHMHDAAAFFAYARATAKAQSRGLPAPEAGVDCVEFATTLPFQQGLEREFEVFSRLRTTAQFVGLRHVFLAERKALEVEDLPPATRPRPIERAVVIGGGTMGSGITISLANGGLSVTMVERDQNALDRGLTTVRQYYEGAQKKGRLSAQQAEQRLSLIKGALDYQTVAEADLVIEAIFEDLQAKREVFEQIDALVRPGALLASNTSMLDINQIAAFTGRPQDVLGLHFFSPAQVMNLLEVVEGERTGPEVMATAMAFARRIGKTAVVSGVCEGFIGNRMLQPYMMQAGLLLDEGALPHQVDRAIERWGMAMGPFRVSDLAGNDLGAQIREQRLTQNPNLIYSRSFDAITRMGRFGQKVGRGWYDYIPGQRAPQPSGEVNAVIEAESRRLGIPRRTIGDEEIVERLLFALINEGAKILEEGIAQRSSDIDVVYTAGYGFPRWRGGPMFCADQLGLKYVLAKMRHFARGHDYQRCEGFWRPSALLCQLAEREQSFSVLNQSEKS